MTPKLRIAVIGAGARGANLARNFHNSPRWELVAICDIDRDRARKVADTLDGARAVTALSELLDAEDLDAVAVATPARTHHGITRAALSAGKHVMVEMPLADTGARGRDMVRAAAERGLVLMAVHAYCYAPAVLTIRDLIQEGSLGDILFIDSLRIEPGLIQPEMDVFWDLAPHDLSVLDFILPGGLRPLSVSAQGDDPLGTGKACVGYLLLPLANGATAQVYVNRLSPTRIRRMIVGGTKCTVLWDDLNPQQTVSVYDRGGDFGSQALDGAEQTTATLPYRPGNPGSPIVSELEALGAMACEFADSIRQLRAPRTDGEAGLRVLSVLEAATRSLATAGSARALDEDRLAARGPA
ncbi:Gfo/Idh/MocA family oxidoreductase [Cryobacterium sp. TMT1-21]|uniref:Gfo/Idh/MocA family oxidoreductase n=1 Tax=Cryobacterium shii TaxID=1259235 RepID=A0AAQ2C668_9MICO|nr:MULTISPECIES: Gfo/Idh/MocA family oxidoreductase [Cryobacterium]TFC46652.1 Gfo/Idh/MocA family oxidoreductase [Cryobacterium shii]TFD17670.1 Gfo/Idh/MocA family oxidoreductase [Cryobacterium sp. TMT1-21]